MLKKEIIMKILSIITGGGKCVKLFYVFIITALSVVSCDTGFFLTFEKSYQLSVEIPTETGVASIRCMNFMGNYYLLYDLKGNYMLNPDSIKLMLNDENIASQDLEPVINGKKKIRNIERVKDCSLSIALLDGLKK